MSNKEFNEQIKVITIDGEQYVNKRDLLAVIKEMKRLHMDGTEPGYIETKKGRKIAAMLALNKLGAVLNYKEAMAVAEERVKAIEKEKAEKERGNRSIILNASGECFLYFRGWCKHIAGYDGKCVPVFSEDPNDAVEYDTVGHAARMIDQIKEEYPDLDLKPVKQSMPRTENGLRILHAIYGWPEDRDPHDVLDDELFWVRELG